MDLTEFFKRKGYNYRYVYMLGNLSKPDEIKIVDSWEKELISNDEIDKQKRELMKNYKMPVIDVKVEEI
ncbi:hypothetical protein Elgi_37470 [Paenibacillus elgii]|uniref:hypothetical protein n=1 Tax=Paenibacillus elgii TaxID=189691 RepID=UPI002D7AF9CA|nr:hypothetical protein Elgi_37470 [Paenibacillus elgii]